MTLQIVKLGSLVGAAGLSPTARLALFCLIGLLLVTLGFLIAFALMLRKRSAPGVTVHRASAPVRGLGDDRARQQPQGSMAPVRAKSPPPVMIGGAGLAVATDDVLACPTCRREYQGEMQFCPHDSRPLVPASEMLTRSHQAGRICPTCSRAYEPGVQYCSHDATELITVSVFEASRGGRIGRKSTGVMAKICPQCRHRYDLAATFCARDGSELAVVN